MSDGECILVVDDEQPNRQLLEAILVPQGFRVVHAEHGQEALDRIAEGGVDLVLLDVLMPGFDGIETCRRIREDLGETLLPVIMVTALADRQSRVRSKRCGADDFLTKPIFDDELLARIRTLLTRCAYYRDAESERARAQAEARRWKLVSDVASVVSACRDYETLQLSICELLRPHLPIEKFLFLEMSHDALCLTVSGPSPVSGVSQPPPRKVSGVPWQTIWGGRRVLAAEECVNELRPIAMAIHRRKPTQGAVLPLHVGGILQGLLILFTGRALHADELQLTEELGPHLSNAVTNVRSHLKAKELNEARDRLSLLLVHDLKNPLSVISMNLEMLSRAQVHEGERVEMLRDSSVAADRMLQLIMDLLDIGRAEEGQLILRRSVGSVRHLIQEVCSQYAISAQKRDVEMLSDLEPGVFLDADYGLLTRVLENLVGNALRFAPRGGAIEMRSRVEDGCLVLQVRNNGPAITPEARDRLFEKYGGIQRNQASPNRGLGLYFCRLVVEAHGGSIQAHEPPEGGVVFEMHLPGAQVRLQSRTRGGALSRSLPPSDR